MIPLVSLPLPGGHSPAYFVTILAPPHPFPPSAGKDGNHSARVARHELPWEPAAEPRFTLKGLYQHPPGSKCARHSRLPLVLGFACAAAILGVPPLARSAPPSPPAILQELRAFREMGSVLYVAAHPDDENTQLITYLARGRNYRTAYLSLTRGDGGQNVLGPEFGEELGVIRTQELLAARRLDGGRQFFTRAIDFGFSKDDRETLQIWDRQQVLADIVRVIRTFRPDVVITRFSTQGAGPTAITPPQRCWRSKPSKSPATPTRFRTSSANWPRGSPSASSEQPRRRSTHCKSRSAAPTR